MAFPLAAGAALGSSSHQQSDVVDVAGGNGSGVDIIANQDHIDAGAGVGPLHQRGALTSHGVPGAADADAVVGLHAGDLAGDHGSLLKETLAVGIVGVLGSNDIVVLGNAVIPVPVAVVALGGEDGVVAFLEGDVHIVRTDAGDLAHGVGGDLQDGVVGGAVVGDQLNRGGLEISVVAILGSRTVAEGVDPGGDGRSLQDTVQIHIVGGGQIILGAVQLGLGAVHLQLLQDTGLNGILAGGIHAEDHSILAVVVFLDQNADGLVQQVGVIVVHVGPAGIAALVGRAVVSRAVQTDVIGGLAVVLLHGIQNAVDGKDVILVLQQGDLVLGGAHDLVLNGALGGELTVGVGDQGVVVLDLVGAQSVPDHLGGVLTGQRGVGVDVAQAVIEALGGGVDVDVHSPVGAGVLLHVLVVAQGDQQHLGSLGAGDVAGGVELVVAHASDDALLHAGLDVRGGPAVIAHVGEHDVGSAQNGLVAAVEQHADHLGHLLAGDVALRIEGSVGHTVDDVQRDAGINGFLVTGIDRALIGERSACANDHDAEHHCQSENHNQYLFQVSHWGFLLKNF